MRRGCGCASGLCGASVGVTSGDTRWGSELRLGAHPYGRCRQGALWAVVPVQWAAHEGGAEVRASRQRWSTFGSDSSCRCFRGTAPRGDLD